MRKPFSPPGPAGMGLQPAWVGPAVRWGVLVIAALFIAGKATVTVGAGERAVIFNCISGVQRGELGEGLHFLWPILQQPTVYDIKTATYTMSGVTWEGDVKSNDALTALTADGQTVALDMSIRYHADPDHVWRLHQSIGPDYKEKLIRPQARAHTRMVVAGFNVIDVYSGRRMVIQDQIKSRLRESFAKNDIILDDVLLRDVKFSPAFQQAIEQKQVALQDAQRMVYELDRARKERDRKVIEAQGAAEAIRLKADALAQNPQLVQYEYVQKLPANVKTVITDTRTIMSMGDLLGGAPARTGEEGRR